MKLSLVIPVFNEADSLPLLWERLKSVLDRIVGEVEIIFVDDGSTDGGGLWLKELARAEEIVRVIRFRCNFGQTAAMSAGFAKATGEIIIPMDADGQNDPEDIPKLLEKLEEGYDVASGWRRKRKDGFLNRLLPSWLANRLISLVTGVRLHDYGCTLKAYRREILEGIPLYGEMHRFLPAYAVWQGARLTEVEVNHFPRKTGKSKYGIGRTFNVLFDLLTTKFLISYLSKPSYAFGRIGLLNFLVGAFLGGFVIYEKYALGIWAHKNPLLLLAMFLGVIGVQFLALGLLAEILARTYFETRRIPSYVVAETIN